MVAGSPATPTLLAAAIERLGPILWQGYGQAESGMISLLTPELVAEHGDAALASVGRPLPEVEIRLQDGEICVRSPHVMAGYWDDPDRTREVLVDGWLHTRDLGHLDDRGLLVLAGRTRDVILVNAEVCYAGAVEAALAGHPDVDEAYVVGAPDDRTGEAIHAFVVLVPGRSLEPQALAAHVRRALTPGHVPATFTALPEAPVSLSGKPDKQALLRSLR
jgi:acyl-CoA synthetase (AMP-forming)/AMP-acid ligase II